MNNKKQYQNIKAFDFMDGFGVFGWFFSSLISLIVFSYVFYGLFSAENPVVSTIFAFFGGMIAVCLASPLSAAAGFLIGAALSGLMAVGLRAAPKS